MEAREDLAHPRHARLGPLGGLRYLRRGQLLALRQELLPENAALGPTTDCAGQLPAAHRAVVSACEGKGNITVSLVFGAVAAIVSEQALRALWADRPRRKDCSLEELWHVKARNLNILLSAQGHPVGQRGAHTGVAIDTFMGRFSTLPNERPSLIAARDESAASEVSSSLNASAHRRVGGKALHYGCVTLFPAVAAPSLSLLMRSRGTGAGTVEVPALDAEKAQELKFVWYMEVRMSERARMALEFMHVAVARYGDAGQPPWPVALSSLYGALLAGGAKSARILAITFDASVDGWGPWCAPHRRKVARRSSAVIFRLPLFVKAFVDPAAHPACPAPQVYRETWAAFLATRTSRAFGWSSVCSGKAHRPDQQRLLGSDFGDLPVPCLAERGAAAQAPLHGLGRFTSALPACSRLGQASRGRG
jgi:hypothetical protein